MVLENGGPEQEGAAEDVLVLGPDLGVEVVHGHPLVIRVRGQSECPSEGDWNASSLMVGVLLAGDSAAVSKGDGDVLSGAEIGPGRRGGIQV